MFAASMVAGSGRLWARLLRRLLDGTSLSSTENSRAVEAHRPLFHGHSESTILSEEDAVQESFAPDHHQAFATPLVGHPGSADSANMLGRVAGNTHQFSEPKEYKVVRSAHASREAKKVGRVLAQT